MTTFVYDDLGRLTNVIDPIVEAGTDKVVSMSYDQLGNRLKYTDRLGESTHYTYDLLNRLVKEEYLTDSINAEKTYDQYGDMVSTSYVDSIYSYTFDAAHRLTRKTDNRNNLSMTWQYDIIGNVIRKTNFQNQVQKYVYDSTNRLVSMSVGEPVTLQASYHYDPAGRLLSRILSNGSSTLYTYSADGFLLTMKQVAANGSIIDVREYQQDHVGNIRQLVINGSETINYTYDPAYRLTKADSTIDSHDIAYTYDAVGNRMSKAANNTVHHYVYENGNQLDTVQSSTGSQIYRFDYDANGSLLKKYDSDDELILDIQYDQRRLASIMNVAQPAANQMSFEYDANAYRIEKQDSSGAKKYFLEGEHLESVYDESDELQANYLRGVVIDEVIAGFEKNNQGLMESRTFHHDQVNSVVALTDHNGSAAQTLAYGPFGESLASTGRSQNSMQYTGREQDNETGLHYYRARYYDAELGRFISEDPIGFEGGINFYAYVGNNPLTYNDPFGQDAESIMAFWGDVGTKIGGYYNFWNNGNISEGVTVGASTINPFTSDNGDVLGFNIQEFSDGTIGYYEVTGDGAGVDVGAFLEYNLSYGSGGWHGDFESINFGYGVLSGSVFWSPGDGGWIGVSLGGGAGLPALSYQETYYDPVSNQFSESGDFSYMDNYFDNLGTSQNGGFVIYPSKVNNNSVREVYSK